MKKNTSGWGRTIGQPKGLDPHT